MASVIMAASFIGGATASALAISPRSLVITNSMKTSSENQGEKSSNGRREVVFAAITATVCSVAGLALADGMKPPKRGSPEAKKAYGPVCVANPTARICNN